MRLFTMILDESARKTFSRSCREAEERLRTDGRNPVPGTRSRQWVGESHLPVGVMSQRAEEEARMNARSSTWPAIKLPVG